MRQLDHYITKELMDSLKSYARKLINTREKTEDREDLVQETLVKIVRFFDRYDQETDAFDKWAITIMHNHYLDEYRKRELRYKRMQVKAYDTDDSEAYTPLLIVAGDKGHFTDHLFMEYIEQAIDNLPTVESEVLRLYMLGYSNTEITEKVALSYEGVKSALFRCRYKLRVLTGEAPPKRAYTITEKVRTKHSRSKQEKDTFRAFLDKLDQMEESAKQRIILNEKPIVNTFHYTY
jgi:RNA polymerase sigma factor (sigma-70 family)